MYNYCMNNIVICFRSYRYIYTVSDQRQEKGKENEKMIFEEH